MSELIIPRTDTPGAKEAGVPWRIDQAVKRNPKLHALYANGLRNLNDEAVKRGTRDFVALPADDQLQILTAISLQTNTPPRQFFDSLKALTIEWYYKSEIGLAQELGFKGNTYRTEFAGCTHPEHWPADKDAIHAS